MKKEVDCSACSVKSGCELFLRFITLATALEEETFEAMRGKMLLKGKVFLDKMMEARGKIASKGAERLPDGARILVHSRSRTVLATLKEAHNMKKRLFVYVTECASNNSGQKMKTDLCVLLLYFQHLRALPAFTEPIPNFGKKSQNLAELEPKTVRTKTGA